MTWKIEFDKHAAKDFKNLDKAIQKQIDKFLLKLMKTSDARQFGAPLHGELKGLWKYRVGDYRLISEIEDHIITIFVIKIRHRREVYK